MARRTKRPTVVWLPNDRQNRLGVAPSPAAAGTDSAILIAALGIPAITGPVGVVVLPVVLDEPQGLTLAQTSLADVEGSAYRLRRIVGKIFIQPAQRAVIGINDASAFVVTAGFIILRTDDVGNPLSLLTPTSYDPQSLDNIRDPWIWRRTWFLSNLDGRAARNVINPDERTSAFAQDTLAGPGAIDGPHVDAKTARIVSDEERLFLVVSAVSLDGTAQGLDQLALIIADLRVLVSMRKQSGNRRNASR